MDHPLLPRLAARSAASPPTALAADEPVWDDVRGLYDLDASFTQLNYGFYHPSLTPVFEAELATARELNRRASHFKRFDAPALAESARAAVADLVGAEADEIVVTRSASEALNLVLSGLPFESGDEVVCSDRDYTAAEQALGERGRFDGVRVVRVSLPAEPTDDEVVRAFEAALTPRTKLLLVTQVIHVTGQILPAAELCALARRHGVPVLVDAAHALGQLEVDVRALDCDYLAAALHKWVGAPLGTGVLYVRRDRIAGVRPLFGDTAFADTDVRKLERFGNRTEAVFSGLLEALKWHRALGWRLKAERLALLRRRWTEPLRALPGVTVLSSREHCAGLSLFAVKGWNAPELVDALYREFGLHTAVQTLPSGPGVRVVPGFPSRLEHLDGLVEAVRQLSARGQQS